MTMSLLKEFLGSTYELMCSIKVPGFNISFMSVFMGAFGAVVSVAVMKLIFGLGNSAVSSLGSMLRSGQHGGNNKNIKISENRKGDTH